MNKVHPFYRLPAEAQMQVLAELDVALKWRGWDRHYTAAAPGAMHAVQAVQAIADIYAANGLEYEEYT